MSESYPNAVKCVTCGVMTPRYNINHLGRCGNCQRRVDDDEALVRSRRAQEESDAIALQTMMLVTTICS